MAKTIISKLLGCSAFCSLLAFNASAVEIATNTAQMQAMDKITGKVSLIEVPVNGAVKFGSFSILVRSCKTRSPEETPENFAFVDVVDDYNDKPANIFRGWMVSSSPALNAVEHPIYDVWLLKCIDTKVDQSKLLTAEQLKERDALETVSASEKVVELNPEVVGNIVETPKAEDVPAVGPEMIVPEELAPKEEVVPVSAETNEIVLSPEESAPEDGAPKSLLDFDNQQQVSEAPAQEKTEENVEPVSADEAQTESSENETLTEKIVINDTTTEDADDKKSQLIEFEEEVEEPLDFEAEALKKE